jgi:hypothetical protein
MRDARNWLTVELGEVALGEVVLDAVVLGEVVLDALVLPLVSVLKLLVESEDEPW